jgi:micrococcal nuclease
MNKMKKIAFLLVLCVFGGVLVGCIEQNQSEYQRVLVTQVVDGDTITVEGGLQVRLIGIDAPERAEECYTEAREYLKSMILYKEVDLEKDITDKDQYGRSLRYVWLGNKLVNAEIVRAGVAIAKQYDPDTTYQHIIADAEQAAIEKQVGCLWSLEVQATTISVPTLTPTQTPTLPTSVNAKAGETSYVNEALPPALPTHIIINEVEANPPEEDSGNEWVELYNPAPKDVDLRGWTLKTTHGRMGKVTCSGTIDANGYRVFGTGSQWLDNEGDSVILRDNGGAKIDEVAFTDTETDDHTWQRYPNGEDSWEFRWKTKGYSNGG